MSTLGINSQGNRAYLACPYMRLSLARGAWLVETRARFRSFRRREPLFSHGRIIQR
jgi:hypothetical protein